MAAIAVGIIADEDNGDDDDNWPMTTASKMASNECNGQQPMGKYMQGQKIRPFLDRRPTCVKEPVLSPA